MKPDENYFCCNLACEREGSLLLRSFDSYVCCCSCCVCVCVCVCVCCAWCWFSSVFLRLLTRLLWSHVLLWGWSFSKKFAVVQVDSLQLLQSNRSLLMRFVVDWYASMLRHLEFWQVSDLMRETRCVKSVKLFGVGCHRWSVCSCIVFLLGFDVCCSTWVILLDVKIASFMNLVTFWENSEGHLFVEVFIDFHPWLVCSG